MQLIIILLGKHMYTTYSTLLAFKGGEIFGYKVLTYDYSIKF